MAIVFKAVKYKHHLRAKEIKNDPAATEEDHDNFVMSLVKEWDFVDKETGQPVAVGNLDELEMTQYNEVIDAFNAQFAGVKASTRPKRGRKKENTDIG